MRSKEIECELLKCEFQLYLNTKFQILMSAWRIIVVVNKSVLIFLVLLNVHAITVCKSIPQTMRNVLVSKWFLFILLFY